MRIAIYYDILPETGYRNDGNSLYTWASLKRMQDKGFLEVDHLAPSDSVSHYGKYDLNISVDWGEDALAPIIPYKMIEIPKPNLYWASDTHLGFNYRFETAKKFDKVFCAQKQAAIDFKERGVDAEWLPHAFEPFSYQDISTGVPIPFSFASKEHDVCFVGHINSDNRVDFLDKMFKQFPNFFFGQRRFQDAARIYAKSKICLNIAMKEDLNMRCFEVMGSGGFLLTDYVPYIEELFEDGKHLVLYRSIEEAIDKAKYYLSHDEEREKIAQAGLEEVTRAHTIDHRVGRMLEVSSLIKL